MLHDALRASKERHGVRIVHFSAQTNHMHLLVEARDERALARGMQGLSVRMARGLNRLWKRTGRVLADRYHSRILRTPREVRYALAYVLLNAKKHGIHVAGLDPHSSGAAFDGWLTSVAVDDRFRASSPPPVATPRTWLLRVGWLRHGRIGVDEVPGRSSRAPSQRVARHGAALQPLDLGARARRHDESRHASVAAFAARSTRSLACESS